PPPGGGRGAFGEKRACVGAVFSGFFRSGAEGGVGSCGNPHPPSRGGKTKAGVSAPEPPPRLFAAPLPSPPGGAPLPAFSRTRGKSWVGAGRGHLYFGTERAARPPPTPDCLSASPTLPFRGEALPVNPLQLPLCDLDRALGLLAAGAVARKHVD